MSITINSTVKKYPTSLPYAVMAKTILGESYELTLNFIGLKRATSLNQKYRNKDYTPDVLSFPLDKQVGEIYISPAVAAKAALKFFHTPSQHTGFLFIHGCLHLRGFTHGAAMSKLEQKYLRQFKLR